MVKSQYDESNLPNIDQLYIDLNGIIYRCVMDETSAYKSLIKGKR